MNVFLIIIDESKNLLVFEIFESMFFPQFSRRLFSFWCWVSSVPSCPVSALIGKSPSNRSFSSYLVSLFQNESPFMWKWVWFAPRRSFLYGKAQAQSYLLSILWSRLNRSLSSSVRFRPGGFSSANLTRSFLPEEVFYKCNWFFKVIFFTTFVPVYLQYSAVIKECLWVIITFIN